MTLKEKLNSYGLAKEPFFFCISFDLTRWEVIKLSELSLDIKFEIDNKKLTFHKQNLNIVPMRYKDYLSQFNKIQEHIRCGNTYVANLTSTTILDTRLSLEKIYEMANAKFKLYFQDKFICFSPERFIKCKNNQIFTYPMKGTIDATVENAKEKILADKKELAEHTMIVDLLRNDLSIVSSQVKVNRFRYCETIDAGDKKLIQVSSEISGKLETNWHSHIGDILVSLLPAGSITGAPKRKTTEIIHEVESHKRDFFSGVFGVFDGNILDSAVMIRFIQKKKDGLLVYKSGGGITCDSDAKSEYQEMLDKVYIP